MPQEENGPVPQQEEFGSGQPKLADVYRPSDERLVRQHIKLMMSRFEKQVNMLEKRLARLEYDARQPRLAMEIDGLANTKTRVRTEGAVTAVQAMRGGSFSACRVDPGPMTNSTSFGMMAEPPSFSCRDDIVVKSGDAAPNSCLPSLEIRSSTAAGGLVPTGKTSTATETTVNKPLLQFYSTEEENSKKKKLRTSIPSA